MSEPSPRRAVATVLVVDDEEEPLRATARLLRRAGYRIDTATDGASAARAVAEGRYDAIVSDIAMPGMNGIQLLQHVRERDAETPVILITGAPGFETAVQALEHGAYKYLVKPVEPDRLEAEVERAVQLARMAEFRREALRIATGSDLPNLIESFREAQRSLWVAFQPIVDKSGELFGYEALMRTRSDAHPNPGAMLDAAERLGRINELGHTVRLRAAESLAGRSEGGTLFINLHPEELRNDALLDGPLADFARSVVLEVTERANLAPLPELRKRIASLRSAGYRIAVDDLGAGYAGLNSFALLEPDIVKVDMTLVRDIHRTAVKQRLVQSIISLCHDMDIVVVGEGVETLEERDQLIALGCDLLQGYLIGRPGPPFPAVHW